MSLVTGKSGSSRDGTITVGGKVRDVSRRVYQRNDIDFDYINPATGKSNLELIFDDFLIQDPENAIANL